MATIADKITAIYTHLQEAFAKIAERGGTYDGEHTTANIADAIDTIPQGGGDGKICDGEYSCNISYEWHEGLENCITALKGNLVTGASSANRTLISKDITFKRLKYKTGNEGVFRFVTIDGDLYFPELEETNKNAEYGMIINYSSVRDIYAPKLKKGFLGFSSADCVRNVYLGSTIGGIIKVGYYRLSFNKIVFSKGFGNSFDYKGESVSHDDLLDNINALYDFIENPLDGFTPILTIGSANLAKLSDEEQAIATAKGWTLA